MLNIVIVLLALLLAPGTDAQIPIPCANTENLTARECCPTPTVTGEADPGPCGVKLNIKRGSCQVIGNYQFTNDVRQNWPLGYFNSFCVCSERFGGYDCGECSFAYVGNNCSQKVLRTRKSLKTLSEEDWSDYHNALRMMRSSSSRYMVVTAQHTTNVHSLVRSMKNPTLYELFVWMHHFAAKDSELTDPKDFAHESTGFPTWHRLFLLWLEREIQLLVKDPEFTLHYWEWTHPGQRRAYFTEDRLGNNNNGDVQGDLFENWNTICWNEVTDKNNPVPICDPTQSTGALRRCPNETACESNTNWPTSSNVEDAVSIKDYDVSPFNKYIEKGMSFRNTMEGFISQSGSCTGKELCTEFDDGTKALTRLLHNSVHIILGIGDFKNSFAFSEKGVMGDVAASPNDPIFINHHARIDCILEEWLQEHKGELDYPISDEIHDGHRANDYIVPFIPLYNHSQMFKTADNFGYRCAGVSDLRTSGPVYLTSLLAALLSLLVIGNI